MAKHFENLAIFPGSELQLIRAYMLQQGIAENKWLFGSGLSDCDEALLAGVSLRQFDIIYRNVYRLVARPELGIELGLSLNLSRWGMLTSALLCANTLGHALSIANEFREILRSRFTISAHVSGEMLVLGLTSKAGMKYPVHEIFSYEVFLGTLQTQISQLLATPIKFAAIYLPYSQPATTKHYQKVCETPVRFNAQKAELFIPKILITRPLPMANRVTRKLVIAQCYEELNRVKSAQSDDILYKVRSLLAQCDDELPELTEAAALLSVSARTLRRKLQQHNVQYRQLCEHRRQQIAISLLSSTTMNIKAVAERCGFADSPSFHKAFKRWTGLTPSQYRTSD